MVLFFDIDGTIWDYKNDIPDSTIEGIRRARAKGHKCFLNSGRARAFINNEKLLGIGFDGIVSACGTRIEHEGKVIYSKLVEKADAVRTVETVRKYGFKPILEGHTYLYMEQEDFLGDMFAEKVIREMGDKLRGIDECWGEWEMHKLSCATEVPEEDRLKCFDELSDIYDLMIHDTRVVEMVPKGFNKGTGIEKVCELLGEDVKNTFAFGDSINDKEMLLTAGVGVAMGNSRGNTRDFADYVTDDLYNDGIFKALNHFGLI